MNNASRELQFTRADEHRPVDSPPTTAYLALGSNLGDRRSCGERLVAYANRKALVTGPKEFEALLRKHGQEVPK